MVVMLLLIGATMALACLAAYVVGHRVGYADGRSDWHEEFD